jgi:branched-chain amino acid transport system ATP-binding protein
VLLSLEAVDAVYGKRRVLHGVTLEVRRGEIVTVLGHNGAGKTTMLKAAFGLVPVVAGRVVFDGEDATNRSNVRNVKQGMSFTPAEAPIFRDLTVAENLELGAFTVTDAAVRGARLDQVLELFPILAERRKQLAGTLSGGQQRMVSLGIALMAGPKLMLLDEPSLGIAPGLAKEIFQRIRQLAVDERLSVLLVEQNVRAALPIADRAYFMRAGEIILEEPAEQALARGHWWDLF